MNLFKNEQVNIFQKDIIYQKAGRWDLYGYEMICECLPLNLNDNLVPR